jgi:hypothetical protein
MKMRQTNGNIGDIRQYVDEARNGYTISNFHSHARSALAKVLLDEISRLDDRQLEQLIAWYFKKVEQINRYKEQKDAVIEEYATIPWVISTCESFTVWNGGRQRNDR